MLYHTQSAEETIRLLGSNAKTGLSSEEAEQRLARYGANQLKEAPGKSLLARFLAQFADFMILVLIFAAAISFVISLLEGKADYIDPCIIFSIILVNAILGVIQEAKAERSLAALKKLSAPFALVLRDGHISELPSSQLVPGDIIHLKTGHFIPADARLISCQNLKVDESALTGESVPVSKKAEAVFSEDTPAADRKNMVPSTGIVTYGHGVAIVTATGMETEVGQIAALILTEEVSETPLQHRMAKTGKILGIAALVICVLIFLAGAWQGRPIFDMFMTSVSLAVAAIPEGLPAVITIMLSLGVQRMAKRKAIVRRLPAVEALGSATVICSDKTGTLTQNRMSVAQVYSPSGSEVPDSPASTFLFTLAALCTNVSEDYGEPTEKALVEAAQRLGLDKPALEARYPRVYEIPFDSARKRMTTVHRLDSGHYRIITKGAPDLLYSRCRFSSDAERRQLETWGKQMASHALRVLAVAWRDIPIRQYQQNETFLEQDLTFCGLVGMIDPPRPEVPEAVAKCKQAGIIPVMITGDHAETASAIAAQIGIQRAGQPVVTGSQLDAMSEEELSRAIRHVRVFARVSPSHKVRIVKAFRSRGELVAMTGDGVNDAPALKTADIGCAMGEGGTDVAKDASDIILADDNFATIIAAVEEGRGIYDNIRKSIHFLLSCNIGEILTILVAILFGLPAPLLAVQLLWVNLVTDSLPAISLGTELPDLDVMKRKPVPPSGSFFTPSLTIRILLEGALIGGLSLIAFLLGMRYGNAGSGQNLTLARTMSFCVLSLSQLFHSFNMRSSHSLFSGRLRPNPRLFLSFLLCAALQISVVTVPPLAAIFRVMPLSRLQWATVLLLSMFPLPVVELQKRIAK